MGRNVYVRDTDDIIRAGHDDVKESANESVTGKLDRGEETQ